MKTLHQRLLQTIRRLGARAYFGLAAIFSVLIVGDFGISQLLSAAETRMFDTLVSHRLIVPKPDPDIVIIDIDEASLAAMSAKYGRWPWPNEVFGTLVTAIEKQKPAAIVFDILFSDRDSLRAPSDEAFNAVIAQSRTTYFPMLRLDPKNDALSQIPISALPGVTALSDHANPNATVAIILPKLPAAIDNGRLGTHQVVPDRDGIIRRYPAWLDHAGWRIPSLPQRLGEDLKYPPPAHNNMLLNWRGAPFSYPYRSFVDVFEKSQGTGAALAEPDFKNKIVLIGSTAPSLFDIKGTPMARIHPGVEILATAIDNVKQGDALRERPAWVMVLVSLVLIWSMAMALYRQVRIDVFDKVFVVLQGALVLGAFVVLNLTSWYLDPSAPVSLGLMFFTVVRLYFSASHHLLATGLMDRLSRQPEGQKCLAVLVVRGDGLTNAQRRQLQGLLERGVSRSRLGALQASHLMEEPGLVQQAFADVMLAYWLVDMDSEHWKQEAQAIEAFIRAGYAVNKACPLHFALHAQNLAWRTPQGWTCSALETLLKAIQKSVAKD